ncbi:hypothetical protein BDR07DRAFT_1566901 [Suillus spraguei]|nr:hypothetical protein BDR07DRAFT_1566901 [Suillus spraguei]
MKNHEYETHQEHNVYYPFVDRDEWELAKFLSDNLNQGQITHFLKSEAQKPPTYRSAPQLLTFMDALPKEPKWCCTTIQTEGYITTHPVHLIWRDALEVTWHLFGNPAFANDMEYDPYEIYDNGEQEYSKWMLNQLPQGTTIMPIVLASDKTPVTRQMGGLKMHPTFLTIANIQSDFHMKATAHAWSCMAYMPVPQFVCHPDFTSLLQARVWHRCMDIVFVSVKSAAAMGTQMVDPVGNLCYAFTPLVAYIANLPKQQLIACVSKNVSPVTLAVQSQFGDGKLYSHCYSHLMIQVLWKICKHVDPWKVQHFQEEAKALFLSGVQLPFWHNWRFSDPAFFLIPEVLHTLHKFFFNHVFKWCKEAARANELDMCFCSQHKHVGTHHFSQGITHVVQMTGQEHREIQCTIVPTIVGIVDTDFICASPTFTPSSIAAMNASLQEFHHFKGSIILAEAHRGALGPIDHFQIPKLELLTLFGQAIPDAGSILQYTADVSECMLIMHFKTPFEYMAHQFDLYAFLHSKNLSLNNLIVNEFDEVVDMDLAFTWVAHIAPEDISHFKGPRPVRNHFLKGLLSDDGVAAFHVTVWIKFHLQLCSSLCPLLVMPSQQVKVHPPSATHRLGNCGIVLLRTQNSDHIIAQVRRIFALSMRGAVLPPALAQPFIYVQPFEIVMYPWDDPAVLMHHVKYWFVTGADGTHVRAAMVFPLVNVTHAIELIPVFGGRADCSITSACV